MIDSIKESLGAGQVEMALFHAPDAAFVFGELIQDSHFFFFSFFYFLSSSLLSTKEMGEGPREREGGRGRILGRLQLNIEPRAGLDLTS